KSGTRFEHGYAMPLCGPSRAVALTGRYPFRTGLIDNQSAEAIQPDRETMIPTVLKQAGYATAAVHAVLWDGDRLRALADFLRPYSGLDVEA
ncbi:MAG: sulfatase-like hydrolase/transferase, partial [Candidatus Hydrogenedentes bacterium]|nr:sulfatase-like hydrolase/transferase [Candidatus Hydrogenedentota bacterium]